MRNPIRFRFNYTPVSDIKTVEENVVLRLWDTESESMLTPSSLRATMLRLKNKSLLYYRQDVEGDVTQQQLREIVEAIQT